MSACNKVFIQDDPENTYRIPSAPSKIEVLTLKKKKIS